MKRNVGQTDRIIRVIVGIALLALGFFGNISGWLGWVLMILGAILLVTGIIGFCPIYALLKTSTNKK
jgi:hypothetical protein